MYRYSEIIHIDISEVSIYVPPLTLSLIYIILLCMCVIVMLLIHPHATYVHTFTSRTYACLTDSETRRVIIIIVNKINIPKYLYL